MAIHELFVLAEMEPAANPMKLPVIKRIVRSYESKTRADLDMELLSNEVPEKHYTVVPVEHLEA